MTFLSKSLQDRGYIMVEHKPSDEKRSGKKFDFGKHKKTIFAGGLVIAVAIAGIISGIVIFIGTEVKRGGGTVRLGHTDYPSSLDPIYAWWRFDKVGVTIIEQMCEGLFDYEITNEGSKIINNLAINHEWSDDNLNLTCTLREDVLFHDNTPFNAQAVKWNFDRFYTLFTFFGGAYAWKLPDGSWIINKTEVVDEYEVKFVLNEPFAPFLSILASKFTYLVSPASTPADNFLGNNPDELIGTGPFRYHSHMEDETITLEDNEDYWNGRPDIDDITLTIYPNWTSIWEAVKAKEITFSGLALSDEDIDTLNNITGINIKKDVMMANNLIYMNNERINVTMRKAISYAINYTHFIEEIRGNGEPRTRSPIPKPVLFSNWDDFKVPYCNISLARQTLVDAGWNGTGSLTANNDISPGNEWETIANSSFPLANFNFTYITGNFYTGAPAQLSIDYLKQIGVKIEATNVSYFEYIGRLFGIFGYPRTLNNFELFVLGWNPDYNDPHIVSYPLFSNKNTSDNLAQVNNSLLQQLMEEAIAETNETLREQLYDDIQKQLIEEIYPMAWLYQDIGYYVYLSNLQGLPLDNPFKFSFKNAKFVNS
jgi:peptide/nickel transport system substrate-binding protein